MFYVPGMLGEPELELFAVLENMSERKRGTAAAIDIDALLQDTAAGGSACVTVRRFRRAKGARCGSAVLLMSNVCSVS